MGITAEEFFQNVYKVIFEPKSFFESANNNISVRLAAGVAAFAAAAVRFSHVLQDDSSDFGAGFAAGIVWCIIAALAVWFLAALFFEYTAKIFNKSGNMSKFLYFSAFASIPAIFYAPLSLLKNLGEAGYFISSASGLILYVWLMFLYAFSLKAAYDITIARAFMFIFLPLISLIPAVCLAADLFSHLRYIFLI